MPSASHNSRKYAEALLLLADAAGRISSVEADLKSISQAITANPELLRFLADDFVKTEGKQDALVEIFSGRADPLLLMFVRMLQAEGQTGQIASISALFSDLVAARQHMVSGEIVSAVPLPASKIRQIEEETSRMLNKDVSLVPAINDEMLGGVIVRVGNFVIDGSIETELSRARTSLAE